MTALAEQRAARARADEWARRAGEDGTALAGSFAFCAGLNAFDAGMAETACPLADEALAARWRDGWRAQARRYAETHRGTTHAARIHDGIAAAPEASPGDIETWLKEGR